MKYIIALLFSFFITSAFLSAQNDTAQLRGTIKVNKTKEEKIHLRSSATYQYGLSDRERRSAENGTVYQPLPIVEGHAFPFNYSKYFNDQFKTTSILLNGKSSDTVTIAIKITQKGKVYLDNNLLNKNTILSLQCLYYLSQIKEWHPAYIIITKQEMFKNQMVIKPKKKNVVAFGTIIIVFSTEPFDN